MREKKCSGCCHWDKLQNDVNNLGSKVGHCRRYPPSPVPMMEQMSALSQPSLVVKSFFPPTDGDATCGEWSGKVEVA